MEKNELKIEITECPKLVKATLYGRPMKDYVALKTKDHDGIYLNSLDSVPPKILHRLKK